MKRIILCLAASLEVLALPAMASAQRYASVATSKQHCGAHQFPWREQHGRRLSFVCVQQPRRYSGPWDAAHEPRPVSKAGVKAAGTVTGLEVTLARHLWCHADKLQPITVSVSEPAGSTSLHLAQLGEEGCQAFWLGPHQRLSLNLANPHTPDLELLSVAPINPSLAGVLIHPCFYLPECFQVHGTGRTVSPLLINVWGRHGTIAEFVMTVSESPETAIVRFWHGGWPRT